MSWNYQAVELMSRSTYGGTDSLTVQPSITTYTKQTIMLSHLDSQFGIHYRIKGSRGGANVTLQWQQSLEPSDSTAWTDIGSSFTWGAGGVYPAVAAADLISSLVPAANTTFRPFLRLKIVCDAATVANINSIVVTKRGLR